MDKRYFEDFEPGNERFVAKYRVTREEILEFGQKWDHLPFHNDEKIAQASAYGGLVASGTHTMAIRTAILTSQKVLTAVIASFGWDDVRFPSPVRPDDELSLRVCCIEKRESRSKPDRGIITNRVTMTNQKGETCLSMIDTLLVAKRLKK